MSALSREQVALFAERGFLVVPDVFAPFEVAELRAAFDRLQALACSLRRSRPHRGSHFVLDPAPPGSPTPVRIQRIVWCGAAEPVLADYGRDRRLLEPAAQLLGSCRMNQLINQAHFKLPGDDVAFPWHQDSSHRRYGGGQWRDVNGRGSFIQTLVALDDIGEDNGPLRFLPGTQRFGHLALPDDGRLPAGVGDPGCAEPALMTAGGLLLFGPYVIHGSPPNRSTRPRRTFLNGFAFPGANSRVYPGRGAGRTLSV